MEILIDLLNFLQPYGTQSYILMFVLLLACGFGFPMPEDIVLVTGGILSSRGITDFWWTNLICMAGVLIGDLTVFTIGRRIGPSVKNTWIFRRLVSEKMDRRVDEVFSRWGDRVVFIGRFTPGLRTPIFLTAGVYRISYWKFLSLDGTAALISVPVWIWLGDVFGNNLEALHAKMKQFQFGVIVTIVVAVIAGIIVYRRRRSSSDESLKSRNASAPSVHIP
jgi:membrane protein DedA with SNARE-associated domain